MVIINVRHNWKRFLPFADIGINYCKDISRLTKQFIYTYQQGKDCSQIDSVMEKKIDDTLISSINVLEINPSNTSDHIPVTADIKLPSKYMYLERTYVEETYQLKLDG